MRRARVRDKLVRRVVAAAVVLRRVRFSSPARPVMERLAPEQLNPFLDPGSPSSFAGFQTAKAFAEAAGIEFYPEPAVTTRYHAFVPEGGGGGRVSQVWRCLEEAVSGEVAMFEVDLLPGPDPFLLGLEYDRNADTLSTQTPALWMSHIKGKCHAFPIYLARDSGGRLRRFVEFRQRPQTLCTPLSQTRRQSGAVKLVKGNPDLFARKLHGWSHYGWSAMRILTRTAGV
jgi:hypothetical protein